MNLAEEMAKLPEPHDSKWPYWGHWRLDLWRKAQEDKPENFVNWPAVYHTMLVRHWKEQMVKRYARLPERYRKVVDLFPDGDLRDNAIEQAYHLFQWESYSGVEVEGLDTIAEFGGGFGQMCWLARKLGFKGEYFIRDLPEFKLLQGWWLETQGIQPCEGWTTVPDLYIGCYSVSEVAPKERAEALGNAMFYLLVYSGEFDRWNNEKWFKKWSGNECKILGMGDRPDYYLLC